MSRPGNMSIKSGDSLKPGQLKKETKKAHSICLERSVVFDVTAGSK